MGPTSSGTTVDPKNGPKIIYSVHKNDSTNKQNTKQKIKTNFEETQKKTYSNHTSRLHMCARARISHRHRRTRTNTHTHTLGHMSAPERRVCAIHVRSYGSTPPPQIHGGACRQQAAPTQIRAGVPVYASVCVNVLIHECIPAPFSYRLFVCAYVLYLYSKWATAGTPTHTHAHILRTTEPTEPTVVGSVQFSRRCSCVVQPFSTAAAPLMYDDGPTDAERMCVCARM